jgi:uncharacterized protein YgiM (DUF1202 family)
VTSKIIKGVVGLAVVVALLMVVNNYWTSYKKASPSKSAVATSTVEASAAAKPEEPSPADQLAQNSTALVLIDGLNFRQKPDATGATIRGLKKGEKFIVVSQNGSWLELKDANGTVGWVTNNPQYMKIVVKKK